jgi:phytoene synthase
MTSNGRHRLAASYAYCDRLARREAKNFYLAFHFLPRRQRLAMCALYAFLRITDDLADEPAPTPERRATLERWRQSWHAALAGDYRHPLHAAFHDTVTSHGIPPACLDAVQQGVEMDLDVVRYETFKDLYPYCYRVASAVGLACIHIWGFRGAEAPVHAEAAGIAFQMTNILRDLREDAERGRIYLPVEDLHRFGYAEDCLRRCERGDRFADLMRFEVSRTRAYYDASAPLAACLDPPGRAVFLTLSRTYRGLLDEMVRRRYDVFSERVRLPRWRKAWLALRAVPVRFGWSG